MTTISREELERRLSRKNHTNARYRRSEAGKLTQLRAHLKERYGITLEDYQKRLKKQKGACAICGHTPGPDERRLVVDHDHETGVVRGLLCHKCNVALGAVGDSIAGIQRFTKYLKRAEKGRLGL